MSACKKCFASIMKMYCFVTFGIEGSVIWIDSGFFLRWTDIPFALFPGTSFRLSGSLYQISDYGRWMDGSPRGDVSLRLMLRLILSSWCRSRASGAEELLITPRAPGSKVRK